MVTLHRILVPLDGSELSERALPLATALAQKFGSEITLLRVLEVSPPALGTRYPENHWMREALQHSHREAQEYVEARRVELAGQGIDIHTLVRDESPAEDILLVAADEKIDLIVMSSHGMGGPSPWTAGSVAHKVMLHSPCPVLLVRQSPEQAGTS
jgi:nucleotide-binding universal stress UspA family protein